MIYGSTRVWWENSLIITKMATSKDTQHDLDSDNEYVDAEQEFQPQSSVDSNMTELNGRNVEPPCPVPPPRTKRNLKKKPLDVTRPIEDVPPNLSKGKLPQVTDIPLEADTVKSELHDPFVTIKEEGLLMNPELLRNSEVTVTSETPLKPSGRANECQPGEIVISSDGDSTEEEPKLHQVTPRSRAKQTSQPTTSVSLFFSVYVHVPGLRMCLTQQLFLLNFRRC